MLNLLVVGLNFLHEGERPQCNRDALHGHAKAAQRRLWDRLSMIVKERGRDKSEVDLSFGRGGRYATDRIRELGERAQLAAQR